MEQSTNKIAMLTALLTSGEIQPGWKTKNEGTRGRMIGAQPPNLVREATKHAKIKRNAKCPCGSREKYKNCHGKE